LSIFSQIRSVCVRCLPKTDPDRPVYQAIQRSHAQKIVQLGIGTGQRAVRLIETAKKASPEANIHYIGIDLFEARSESDGPGLTLKAAYHLLREDRVRVQLIPGNPTDAFAQFANSLGKIDLLIVPEEFDSASLARAWFFVPRMLHGDSLVFVERTQDNGQKTLEIKPRHEIDALASAGTRRRAA
jgi:hypothetical protein